MEFNREKFQLVYPQLEPLLEKHWREVAHYQDIKLNVDHDRYCTMEAMGHLRVYTARDKELTLVGYAVFFVNYNPHYRDSLQAVQDVVFIDREKRGFGREFLNWCDEQLKSEGVSAVYHHVKKAHNWGPMLEKMGYELVDLIYARRLDK